MTVEEARNFLSKAQWAEQELRTACWQWQHYHDLTTNITAMIAPVTDGSHDPQNRAKTIDILADIEESMGERVEKLRQDIRDVDETIQKVQNATYREILRQKYLCNKSTDHIARAVNYSVPYIYTMHNEALEEVARIKTSEDFR